LAEMVDVEMNDVAIKALAKIKQRQIDYAADKGFLTELKEALERYPGHDETEDDREGLETTGWKQLINVLLSNEIEMELSAGRGHFAVKSRRFRRQLPLSLIVSLANLFDLFVDTVNGLLNAIDASLSFANFRFDPHLQAVPFSQALQHGVDG